MTGLLLGVALAGGFTHRESRAPLPAREVERGLGLPSGWTEARATLGRTRWSDLRPRPFPGALERREARLDLAVGLGGGVTLEAGLPWVDLHTAGVLGAGWGSATVGAVWAPLQRVAPDRSAGLEVRWTAPSGQARLPLGPPTHEVVAGGVARGRWGALRGTGRVGVRGAPAARVPWLRDATGRQQLLDPGEAVWASAEALLQAGPLLGGLEAEGAWVAADRVDGQPVVAAGAVAVLRPQGAVQLNRAVTVGLEGQLVARQRTAWLAPVDALAPGRRLAAFLSVAL